MAGLIIGIAVLFMMAAGFVWGREGLKWSETGNWNSFSVNEFYALMAGRRLGFGGGGLGDAVAWMGQMDLGVVCITTGLIIYFIAYRLDSR